MITTLLFDLSRVLLFPKDKNYTGGLNELHKELLQKPDYQFLEHFELNEELLVYLKSLRGKFELYIFTTGKIQNVPEVKRRIEEIFKKTYSVEEIGLSKKDQKSFLFIAKDLGKKPENILYVDDSIENLNVAKRANFNAVQYKSLQDFKDKVKECLKT